MTKIPTRHSNECTFYKRIVGVSGRGHGGPALEVNGVGRGSGIGHIYIVIKTPGLIIVSHTCRSRISPSGLTKS